MLGAIVGDTIGSVFEFDNTKDYNFPLFCAESEYTDDTVLTAAVANWALHDKTFAYDTLEQSLLDFVHAFPNPVGAYGSSFEVWAFHPEKLSPIEGGAHFGVRHPYHSYGNGSAMRVSAIGWLCDSLEETERIAGLSAAITHNHPEGIKGAQSTAVAVYLARNGSTKDEIRDFIEQRYGYSLRDSWEHLHQTYSWDASCQGTVPQAMIAFLDSHDFESAIRMAVSMGGDSDTLACITGAIAEAFYKDIPEKMVDFVVGQMPEKIMKVLKEMSQTAYASCFERYIAPRIVGLSATWTPSERH